MILHRIEKKRLIIYVKLLTDDVRRWPRTNCNRSPECLSWPRQHVYYFNEPFQDLKVYMWTYAIKGNQLYHSTTQPILTKYKLVEIKINFSFLCMTKMKFMFLIKWRVQIYSTLWRRGIQRKEIILCYWNCSFKGDVRPSCALED